MAKGREDVDWYVEMSEMIERRERRRRWVILGAIVSLPLLLMAGLVGAAVISRMKQEGRLPAWFRWPEMRVSTKRTAVVQPDTFEPVNVKSFQTGDIVYSQLDRNGFVTSISHFFRELGPETEDPSKPFTVSRTDEYKGHIVLYRLRNVGTGEVFEFANVPIKRLAAGDWIIGDDGQRQLRDQLQARMRVQIRRIGDR